MKMTGIELLQILLKEHYSTEKVAEVMAQLLDGKEITMKVKYSKNITSWKCTTGTAKDS